MSAKTNKWHEQINKRIDTLEDRVLQLMDVSEHIVGGDTDVILKFNSEYTAIVKEIEKIVEELRKNDKDGRSDLWDKIDSLYDDINYIYDEASIHINNVIASKTYELEDNIRKSQGVQLAVFSIVLSILAFVLTNAKVLAAENIDFKNILLINLSFILSTDVLFSLIYLFMGPVFYSKKGKLRTFVFIALPIILITSIVLISIFAK